MSIHHPHMTTAEIHRQILGERNNVVIPKVYIEFVNGDYVAAVVLKEIVWGSGDYSQTAERDGWMYNSEKDWQDHHFLSRKQVNRSIAHINTCADAILIDKKVSKRTTPSGDVLNENVTYYRLDNDVYDSIFGNVQGGSFGNVPEGSSGNIPEGKSLTINTGTDTGTDTIVQKNTTDGDKTPAVEEKSIDLQIMDAFCEETGLAKFASFATARKQAQQLAKADFTPDEVRELIKWLRAQEWITSGISLGLCLNQADKFRTARTNRKSVAQGGGQVVRKADTEASQKAWDDIMRPYYEGTHEN